MDFIIHKITHLVKFEDGAASKFTFAIALRTYIEKNESLICFGGCLSVELAQIMCACLEPSTRISYIFLEGAG